MTDTISETADEVGELLRIEITRIERDPNQPRRFFDAGALNELAASIVEQGLIQPITVKPKLPFDETDPHYVIVDGERRWRAAALATRAVIPCIVRADLSTRPDTVSVLQLIANLQRADLTLWETAQGCRALVDAIGLERAAEKLGYSKPWVSQRANVADLPEEIRDLIESGLLTDVETAHNLAALAEIDEGGASTVGHWLENIGGGYPPTREDVRRELREAREMYEAEADRERARQQRADDEAAARAAKSADPNAPLFSDPKGDDDAGDQPAAPKPKASTSTSTRAEAPHERERRLREEAWAELMPDCRKLAREARKPLIQALEEAVFADHWAKNFEITLSAPQTSTEAPAKAQGAKYGVDVRGNTADAGLVIEALDASHRVNLNLRVTIAQLRRIEAVTGEFYPVRTCADYGGSGAMNVHGSKLANVAALIKRTQAERDQTAASEAEHQERITRLLLADSTAAARQAEDDALVQQAAALNPNPPAAASEGEGQGYVTAQIARFLAACTRRDPNRRTKAAALHAAYVAWCERHSEGTPVGLRDHRWGQGIAADGIEKKRSDGFVYIGIKLLIDGEGA
ncbi:ParB/RepB/Spo0J family partition protein [Nevskia sp.]|uniref:ParB/RepB/Spo0J family partition protein n=1 Tax=Nevskia sp. TaxID=1929292 RepID=UPI0025E38C85|nr:ParB/RepB/Spo0J family partition protein [Nevskia sp.]